MASERSAQMVERRSTQSCRSLRGSRLLPDSRCPSVSSTARESPMPIEASTAAADRIPGAWVSESSKGPDHFICRSRRRGAVRDALRRLAGCQLSQNRSLQRSRRRAPASRARSDEAHVAHPRAGVWRGNGGALRRPPARHGLPPSVKSRSPGLRPTERHSACRSPSGPRSSAGSPSRSSGRQRRRGPSSRGPVRREMPPNR